MGACISLRTGKRKHVLLLVGLDAAGKTTWLYHLQNKRPPGYTAPTIVHDYEDISYKNNSFALWDLGGQDVYRLCLSC